MTLVAVFVLVFVGGPVVFRALTWGDPTGRKMLQTGMVMVICAAVGMGLKYGLPDLWGADLLVTVGGIMFVWLAWIAVLAFGAQALRRANQGSVMRQWTAVIGALGTTAPWFGLAGANLMRAWG